jgi:signal transduction histidine kinase
MLRDTMIDAALLHAVLDAFPNGSINVFDRDLRYVFAAGRGLTEAGLSSRALAGRRLDELFDPELVSVVEPHYRSAFSGEHRQFQFDAFGKTYHMAAAPITADGLAINHIVVVTQDISERSRREQAVRENEQRLTHAEEGLRALDRRKDAFISTLAHELRQPLAAMTAAVEVVKARYAEVAASSPMAVLDRQIGHVSRLLDDLVDASRLVRGHVSLVREVIDLRVVLRSAFETVIPAAQKLQQDALLTLPETPLLVDGDRTRLQQVFSNLLNNAAKYGREGGHICVVAERHDDQIVVRVRDDGLGIDAELLPHIFELFTQASGQDRGGIGVGLAVVRSLVSAHGGTVEARSSGADTGSEFIVRLPSGIKN